MARRISESTRLHNVSIGHLLVLQYQGLRALADEAIVLSPLSERASPN